MAPRVPERRASGGSSLEVLPARPRGSPGRVPAQPPSPASALPPSGSLRAGAFPSHRKAWPRKEGRPRTRSRPPLHGDVRVASTGRAPWRPPRGQRRALCSPSASPSVSGGRGPRPCIQIKRRGKGRPAQASSRSHCASWAKTGPPQDRGLGKLVFSFSGLHGADLHPEKRAWGVEARSLGQTLLPPRPSPHPLGRPACSQALLQALSVPWHPGVLPLPIPSTARGSLSSPHLLNVGGGVPRTVPRARLVLLALPMYPLLTHSFAALSPSGPLVLSSSFRPEQQQSRPLAPGPFFGVVPHTHRPPKPEGK